MKKRNKKGFTLIELLAVIVILAVIALIAVPQVLKILNKARLSAAEDTVYGIVKSAETYVSNFMLKNRGSIPSESLVFNCNNDGCSLENISNYDSYELEGLEKLEFKGTKPKSGTVRISNNGTSIVTTNLNISSFNCNYPIDNQVICSKDDAVKNNEYVKNNLLVRYNYEDSSNTSTVLKDLSGNGYDGIIHGATITNDGLVFDGVDDYVSIAEINTPNLTWEVRFKTNINNTNRTLIGNHESGGCSIYNNFSSCFIDGKYQTIVSHSELQKISNRTITYDGNVFKFYVDGELIGEYISSSGITYPQFNTYLMLGANPGGNVASSEFFNGSIYSIRIYNRALNEAEIKYNYLIDIARYNA